MVSADALYDIHRRLCEIFVSDDVFGGCAVLLVGDLLQLPPVKGRPIFARPKYNKNASLWNSNMNLWESFEVVTLTVNFRQGVSALTNCFNRLRCGEITNEDRELLENRRLSKFPDLDQTKACHVYYSNYEVDSYNMEALNSIQGESVNLEAEITMPKGYRLYITPHGTIEDSQFRKTLSLKVGARVMVTFNIQISDSLINGALGNVIGFVYGSRNNVIAVMVQFDDPEVGNLQKVRFKELCKGFEEQNGCPIFRTTLRPQGKAMRSANSHGASVKITQFPLRLAAASTGHKLQGTSIKSNLVVHGYVNKKKNKTAAVPKCLYYVMLSRVTKIDNIFLDDNFDIDHIQCSTSALEEVERLNAKSLTKDIEIYDVFFINVRSFSKHKEDLFQDLYAKRAKYVCLAETWIDDSMPSPFTTNDRIVHHSSFGKGRGTCILSTSSEDQSQCVSTEKFQLVTAQVMNIQLTVAYLSKGVDWQEVTKAIDLILDKSMPQMLLGDFNFDVKEENYLTSYLDQLGMVQIVTEPTQKEGRTLDHLYVTEELYERVKCKVQFKHFTDHAALQIKINV